MHCAIMHHCMICVCQVMAEGVSQIIRCLVVVAGVTMATEWGLLVFCAGQVSREIPFHLA